MNKGKSAATQAELNFAAAENIGVEHGAPPSAKSQAGKILRLLIEARGQWVPLYRIVPLAAQYSARISELRALGFQIENRVETVGKDRHSWFRLILQPGTSNGPAPKTTHAGCGIGPKSAFSVPQVCPGPAKCLRGQGQNGSAGLVNRYRGSGSHRANRPDGPPVKAECEEG